MPQESWIAVRAETAVDVHALLSTYGFIPVGEERAAASPDPATVRREKRPPRGYVGFYVFEAAPWTVVLDGESVLWEQLSTHTLVSDLWSALVVVAVTKSASNAFGFGVFERGQMRRWLFRHGDVVGQSYGAPLAWETGAESAASIPALLRERFGIDPAAAPEVRMVYARVTKSEPRAASLGRRIVEKFRRPRRAL